eukprot:scaffold298673_cov34-Prasinocladus_malaysianus.AAC.1
MKGQETKHKHRDSIFMSTARVPMKASYPWLTRASIPIGRLVVCKVRGTQGGRAGGQVRACRRGQCRAARPKSSPGSPPGPEAPQSRKR